MKTKICRFIMEWVELNMTTGCAITELETATGYSDKTLQRWFRESYGVTPAQYLHQRRMTRTAVLLRMTSLPVTEIAETFHYFSSQNFSRAFIKFTGLTPTEYRNHGEWFCKSLQPSLLIDSSRYADSAVCELPDIFIQGNESQSTDNVTYAFMDNGLFSLLQEQVRQFSDNGINDTHVACIAHKPSDLIIGRKDFIKIFLYIGNLVAPNDSYTIHVLGGRYIRWRFSGTWRDYAILSKSACLMLTHGTSIRRRVGHDYIKFHAEKNTEKNQITCDMYIPVTTN